MNKYKVVESHDRGNFEMALNVAEQDGYVLDSFTTVMGSGAFMKYTAVMVKSLNLPEGV